MKTSSLHLNLHGSVHSLALRKVPHNILSKQGFFCFRVCFLPLYWSCARRIAPVAIYNASALGTRPANIRKSRQDVTLASELRERAGTELHGLEEELSRCVRVCVFVCTHASFTPFLPLELSLAGVDCPSHPSSILWCCLPTIECKGGGALPMQGAFHWHAQIYSLQSLRARACIHACTYKRYTKTHTHAHVANVNTRRMCVDACRCKAELQTVTTQLTNRKSELELLGCVSTELQDKQQRCSTVSVQLSACQVGEVFGSAWLRSKPVVQ
eukprot:1156876-Pelagomonas_calceolata.AAC.17